MVLEDFLISILISTEYLGPKVPMEVLVNPAHRNIILTSPRPMNGKFPLFQEFAYKVLHRSN